MTTTQKQQFWHDHVAQWQSTGTTQLAYCRLHELCPHKFGYYKRALETRPTPTQTSSSGFVSVQVLPEFRQPESLTLHLTNGIRLSGICADNLDIATQLTRGLS